MLVELCRATSYKYISRKKCFPHLRKPSMIGGEAGHRASTPLHLAACFRVDSLNSAPERVASSLVFFWYIVFSDVSIFIPFFPSVSFDRFSIARIITTSKLHRSIIFSLSRVFLERKEKVTTSIKIMYLV